MRHGLVTRSHTPGYLLQVTMPISSFLIETRRAMGRSLKHAFFKRGSMVRACTDPELPYERLAARSLDVALF